MRRVRLLAVVAALALGVTHVAVAQDASDLATVKDRLQQIADEVDRAEARASQAGTALHDADHRLAEVEAIVNEVAAKLDAQHDKVAAARARLDRLAAESAAVQSAFEDRMVEMFKRSYGSDLDLVLSAGDIQTAIDRSSLLAAVNRSDRATLEQVAGARGRVETQQMVLDAETERLETLQAEQQEVLAQVRRIRDSRALAVAQAREQVAELSHQQDDLAAEAARIERIIRERQAPPPTISPPSTRGYIWPLCGRVTSEYGRRWGRLHAGIDIDDNRTRAIVAAKAGVVIFAGWSGGYGQLVVVDHRDGVATAYAHQSAIAVAEGQRVERGQRLGTVGSTGNSTGPHLHFETRVNGSPVNPRRFLPQGC